MPTYSQKAHFSFVVLGDTAPPSTDLPVPISLFLIYDDMQVVRPDMIFHTGNAIWAKPGDETGAQLQFYRFRLAADTLPNIPYYIAPGSKDIPDEEADVVFRRNISGGQPWRSFDYGNSHFIVLDSEVPNEQGKIAGQQLSFLQTDLEAHAQAAHTFVFVSRTPFPAAADAPADGAFATTADRDNFSAMMSRYHVNTVFSGGQPVYSSSVHDGVRYVNTGGGG
ncbi:MAG: hypothetical protein LC772_03780, partial [Chloroflexi bacterium]|nr:hypothetical protein [Chloroflexota bacterium]